MSKITRVGVDLTKNVIQVHGVDASGKVVTNRQLPRNRFVTWCVQLPAGCLVAMEACSGAHHWGRKLLAQGLDARLIAAHLVAPYRLQGKGGKNDANDAAAIWLTRTARVGRWKVVTCLAQRWLLPVGVSAQLGAPGFLCG